jgi:hypothetical protein
MVWTKKQLIDAAFDELALGDGAYILEPEQYISALMKLDAMLTAWGAKGVYLGWNSVSNTTQNPLGTNNSSGLPEFCNEAVYLNLALRLANSYGRLVSPDLRNLASSSYRDLVGILATTPVASSNGSIMLGAGDTLVGTSQIFSGQDTNLNVKSGKLEF